MKTIHYFIWAVFFSLTPFQVLTENAVHAAESSVNNTAVNSIIETQIGFGGEYYLLAVTEIIKQKGVYTLVKVRFKNAAGDYQKNIFLDPQNPQIADVEISSAQQILIIKVMKISFPTPNQEGSVYLDGSYTNYFGEGKKHYNQVIATWPYIPEKAID